ncbi:MAG: hypothetical protein ACLFQ8_01305 [Candidatus Aenigmatarchaeota archaeon]
MLNKARFLKKGKMSLEVLVAIIAVVILVGMLFLIGTDIIGSGEGWIGNMMQFLGNLI